MDCENTPSHWKCLRKRKSPYTKNIETKKIIEKNSHTKGLFQVR